MERRATRVSLLAFTALAFLASIATAAHEGYYNYPDIHGDTIVFAADGDLWKVPVSGGVAEHLTTVPGNEMMPAFSPDGKTIAFTGDYDGSYDVYTIPVEGGSPTRLTWNSYTDRVTGWTPDGKSILFFSSRNDPFYVAHVYTVPREGGPSELFPLGQASFNSVNPDGRRVVFNRLATAWATWKRYMGGTSDDVWIGDLQTGKFRELTQFPGHDTDPMWVGDRIYFVSERSGRDNLWSLDEDGNDLRQHTNFTDFDVRFPGTDGDSRIVFQHGADIYLYSTDSDSAERVEILIPSERQRRRERFASPSRYLESFDLSPEGDRLVATTRGELFNLPAKEGRPFSLTNGLSSSREKDAVFAGKDGEKVVFWSDRSGEEELYIADAKTGEVLGIVTEEMENHGEWHFPPVVAPNGASVAWADQVGTLYWTDLTTRTLHTVDDSDIWETDEYEWSPDSRYLAYAKYVETRNQQIFIYDSKEDVTGPITDAFYNSFSPTWDPKGEYLFYLSNRTFDPLLGQVDFETILAPMTKPYMVLLSEESENPFFPNDYYEDLEKDKDKEDDEKDKKEKDEDADEDWEDDDSESAEEVVIDWEGIKDRQIVLENIRPQELYGLTAVKDRVIYLSGSYNGLGDEELFEETSLGTQLKAYNYKDDDPEETVLATEVSQYMVSRDRKHLAVETNGNVYVVKSRTDDIPGETEAVDFGDLRLRVDPAEEWHQIWNELYRLMRDFYYVPDMAGTDWKSEVEKYRPLVDRLSTRAELNDLIGNVIGELGTGHTYVWGGDQESGPGVAMGILGADLEIDSENNAYRFKRIFKGYNWDPDLRAPLGRPGLNVNEGDYLLAINGERVSADRDPESYFWNQANIEVLLTVNSEPKMEGAREIRIVPRTNDRMIRYQQWVNENREFVSDKTDGKVGYIHLPNMSGWGMIEFFRSWFPQRDKQAMIVDVRYNGGGFVSQLVIHRLRRVLYAYSNVRNFDVSTYPDAVFTGPMVCLVNERAGSDGDIVTETFRIFDLGPIIGTRSWGGIIGIRSDKPFVDGGLMTIPEFGWFDDRRGWNMENEGVTPDIVIDNLPEDDIAGRDRQLEKGIEVVLDELAKNPPKEPKRPPSLDTHERFRQKSKEWLDKP
ncbi:PDZ domain-containing protein [bacterium]|nr:PDZ domain-containing protein [bacterium]